MMAGEVHSGSKAAAAGDIAGAASGEVVGDAWCSRCRPSKAAAAGDGAGAASGEWWGMPGT